jgi:hypothetical protein
LAVSPRCSRAPRSAAPTVFDTAATSVTQGNTSSLGVYTTHGTFSSRAHPTAAAARTRRRRGPCTGPGPPPR